MKTKYFLILLLSFIISSCESDKDDFIQQTDRCGDNLRTLYNSAILTTQKEVDDFNSHGYKSIEGDLIIKEDLLKNDPIINLDNLFECLRVIQGKVIIENNSGLKSINAFLKNITTLNALYIKANPLLNQINGFDNLISVRELTITDTQIKNLNDCFSKVTSIKSLKIQDNSNLQNLRGLNQLNETSYVVIKNNSSLENLEVFLEKVKVINSLEINNNDKILDLKGLNSIKNINHLEISFNKNLETLSGFSATSITKDIIITSNEKLENIDALSLNENNNLTYINITKNASLTSVKGLKSITKTNSLYITENNSLLNLDGLDNLKQVGEHSREGIYIEKNDSLENINSLSNIVSVGDLFISFNAKLNNFCGIQNLVTSNSFSTFDIARNAYNPSLNDFDNGRCSL